jgi:Fe-S cluster assembly iron-binding protein IscA
MDSMSISVTKNAAEMLNQMLVIQTEEGEPDTTTRLMEHQDGGFACAFDKMKHDDYVMEYEGQTILILQPEVVKRLEGCTLDINEDGRFTLYNPKDLN